MDKCLFEAVVVVVLDREGGGNRDQSRQVVRATPRRHTEKCGFSEDRWGFFILELAGWCAGCVQGVWIARITMVWPGLPDISRGDLLSLLLAASSRGIHSDGQVGT